MKTSYDRMDNAQYVLILLNAPRGLGHYHHPYRRRFCNPQLLFGTAFAGNWARSKDPINVPGLEALERYFSAAPRAILEAVREAWARHKCLARSSWLHACWQNA